MLVYTYCSYKGSLRGYQYSFFDTSKNKDTCQSAESMENVDNHIENMDIIRKWFENRHGWKLVLKKNNMPGEGILLVSRLEEETGIYYKENEESVSEQRFFINIAFAGRLETLMLIAAHYIHDLMDSRPYSSVWTGHMEKFLDKTPDNKKYQLNTAEWNSLFDKIKEWEKEEHNKIMPSRQDNNLIPVRLKRLPGERCRKRRENVKNKIINRLLQYPKYKEEYILFIGNGRHFEEMSKANMEFDISYARNHYI